MDNWGVAEQDSGSDSAVAGSAPNPDGSSFAFDRKWLAVRKAVAAADGKPFIMEEFGAPLHPQDFAGLNTKTLKILRAWTPNPKEVAAADGRPWVVEKMVCRAC